MCSIVVTKADNANLPESGSFTEEEIANSIPVESLTANAQVQTVITEVFGGE